MTGTITADLAIVAIFGLILYYLWLKIAPTVANVLSVVANPIAAAGKVATFETVQPGDPALTTPIPINSGTPIQFYMGTPLNIDGTPMNQGSPA